MPRVKHYKYARVHKRAPRGRVSSMHDGKVPRSNKMQHFIPCPLLSLKLTASSCELLHAVEPGSCWVCCSVSPIFRTPGSAALLVSRRAHAHTADITNELEPVRLSKTLLGPRNAQLSARFSAASATIFMSFSALLGVVSRASGCSTTFWPAAVQAGSPSCVAASVAPRALSSTAWANRWKGSSCRQRNGKPSQQQRQQLLMWCNNAPIYPAGTRIYDLGQVGSARRSCSTARRSLSAMSGSGGAAGEGVAFVETEAAQRRNSDPGCVAFVTGANRGIGLEVTRQLLSRTKG